MNYVYAVANGREGDKMYDSWSDRYDENGAYVMGAETACRGSKGSKVQKFRAGDVDQINAFFEKHSLTGQSVEVPDVTPKKDEGFSEGHMTVYVDGSYNAKTNEYGYGVFMQCGKFCHVLYGKGKCEYGGRNIEGEVAASKAALRYIEDMDPVPGYRNIKLYHDYQGIGSWADHDWSANKPYTKEYATFVDSCRSNGMNIEFLHVDGHTGVIGNERVDKIAKFACGIPCDNSDMLVLAEISGVDGMPDIKATGNKSNSITKESVSPCLY